MWKRILAILAALASLLGACAEEAPRYAIDVNLAAQAVTVYDADDRSAAGIVRQMICSTGVPGTADETPCGAFTVKQHYPDERTEWYYIKQYKVYVQYVTRFNGPYLFHSIPYLEKDVASVDQEARSLLGTPASHGCIRLRSEDAKWIALNCPDGTSVTVREGEADEALRAQLIKYGYVQEEWRSYEEYLCANLSGGLAGAIEARSAEGN